LKKLKKMGGENSFCCAGPPDRRGSSNIDSAIHPAPFMFDDEKPERAGHSFTFSDPGRRNSKRGWKLRPRRADSEKKRTPPASEEEALSNESEENAYRPPKLELVVAHALQVDVLEEIWNGRTSETAVATAADSLAPQSPLSNPTTRRSSIPTAFPALPLGNEWESAGVFKKNPTFAHPPNPIHSPRSSQITMERAWSNPARIQVSPKAPEALALDWGSAAERPRAVSIPVDPPPASEPRESSPETVRLNAEPIFRKSDASNPMPVVVTPRSIPDATSPTAQVRSPSMRLLAGGNPVVEHLFTAPPPRPPAQIGSLSPLPTSEERSPDSGNVETSPRLSDRPSDARKSPGSDGHNGARGSQDGSPPSGPNTRNTRFMDTPQAVPVAVELARRSSRGSSPEEKTYDATRSFIVAPGGPHAFGNHRASTPNPAVGQNLEVPNERQAVPARSPANSQTHNFDFEALPDVPTSTHEQTISALHALTSGPNQEAANLARQLLEKLSPSHHPVSTPDAISPLPSQKEDSPETLRLDRQISEPADEEKSDTEDRPISPMENAQPPEIRMPSPKTRSLSRTSIKANAPLNLSPHRHGTLKMQTLKIDEVRRDDKIGHHRSRSVSGLTDTDMINFAKKQARRTRRRSLQLSVELENLPTFKDLIAPPVKRSHSDPNLHTWGEEREKTETDKAVDFIDDLEIKIKAKNESLNELRRRSVDLLMKDNTSNSSGEAGVPTNFFSLESEISRLQQEKSDLEQQRSLHVAKLQSTLMDSIMNEPVVNTQIRLDTSAVHGSMAGEFPKLFDTTPAHVSSPLEEHKNQGFVSPRSPNHGSLRPFDDATRKSSPRSVLVNQVEQSTSGYTNTSGSHQGVHEPPTDEEEQLAV